MSGDLQVGAFVQIRSSDSFTPAEIKRDRLRFDGDAENTLYYPKQKMDLEKGKVFMVEKVTVANSNNSRCYKLVGVGWTWPRCALIEMQLVGTRLVPKDDLPKDYTQPVQESAQESTPKTAASPYTNAIETLNKMGASTTVTMGGEKDELLKMKLSLSVESSGVSKIACLQSALALVQETLDKAKDSIEPDKLPAESPTNLLSPLKEPSIEKNDCFSADREINLRAAMLKSMQDYLDYRQKYDANFKYDVDFNYMLFEQS
jgi:hypothetical protein